MRKLVKRLVPVRLVRISRVGDEVVSLRTELAEVRRLAEMQNHALLSLNHAVVHGGEAGLPLLIDVVQRIRSDADAVIGAVAANERVLSVAARRLEACVDELRQSAAAFAASQNG